MLSCCGVEFRTIAPRDGGTLELEAGCLIADLSDILRSPNPQGLVALSQRYPGLIVPF